MQACLRRLHPQGSTIPNGVPSLTGGQLGTRLLGSDAHSGLAAAIGAVLREGARQRSRVHVMRNVLDGVPKGNAVRVAVAIRTVFAQPDADHVRPQLDVIAGMLCRRLPQVEACRGTPRKT